MFYINEEKLKEYSVVNYLKTDKFKSHLKPKLLKLIKNQWRENSFSKLFKTGKQLVPPLSVKLDPESLQQLNKYSSYLGKWSEFFLEKLVDYWNLKNQPDLSLIQLENSWEIVRDATKKAEKYFKSKREKLNNWIWFYELGSLPEYKYAFLFEEKEFKKNENNTALLSIMNHFKDLLPHFNNCINWEKFTKQYQAKSSLEHRNQCELSQWEFDFYNSAEKEIVELKFHKKSWELNWVLQTLLYTYLLDFYYGLRVQKIRIINTFSGESLSIQLSELFIERGQEKFYALMKQEISDYEKLKFMNRILASFRDWTINSNLEEIVSNNFFCKSTDPLLIYYSKFIRELNKQREEKNFLSNIHSSNWVWAQWTKFLAQRQ